MTKFLPTLNRRFGIESNIADFQAVAGRLASLLVALYVNRKIGLFFPEFWILLPVFISIILSKTQYSDDEYLTVRLWKLIGIFSAVYSLAFYPLMPPVDGDAQALLLYGLILAAWAGSAVGGLLCFKVPSLAILPPAFLIWSKSVAGAVTGLRITIDIDVLPLAEVSTCIGLGLVVTRAHALWHTRTPFKGFEFLHGRSAQEARQRSFSGLVVMFAIAVHLANYYWSFHQKMTLDGPWFSWAVENNTVYIFLAALDDGHILFSGYPEVVAWTIELFDAVHLYSNAWVLIIQAAAVAAFFFPRRGFLCLLIMFDLMHVAIIVIVGANFLPWIILNLIIIAVVSSPGFRRQAFLHKAVATGFILAAPHFAQVTKLGWYDSGANNKIYLEAVDAAGRHYPVSTNFFTFYSYSIGHMDYGTPDPKTSFAVGSPNGGVWDYAIFRAGRRCDVAGLQRVRKSDWYYRDAMRRFIRNYHRLVVTILDTAGAFPYDLYPHHFFIPPSEAEGFAGLDKRAIVAYVYKRDSVCLSLEDGKLRRRVVATAEYRIDVRSEGGRRRGYGRLRAGRGLTACPF